MIFPYVETISCHSRELKWQNRLASLNHVWKDSMWGKKPHRN